MKDEFENNNQNTPFENSVQTVSEESGNFSCEEILKEVRLLPDELNGEDEKDNQNASIEDTVQPSFDQNGEFTDEELLKEVRLLPDELHDEVEKDAKVISDNMSEQEFRDFFDNFGKKESASEIIEKKEQEKTSIFIDRKPSRDYVNPYKDMVGDYRVDEISDALLICMERHGKVDIEYISAITGNDLRVVIADLESKNAIYQNPKKCEKIFYKGWETADEYLSGNIMLKYKQALEISKTFPEAFSRNIDALSKMLPGQVLSDQIYATIGSPWIPPRYYNEFLARILSIRRIPSGVTYNEVLKRWKVAYSSRDINSRFDVLGMSVVEIFEKTLNNTAIKIYDKKMINGREQNVLNQARTLAGIEKQRELIAEFRKWIFADESRKQALEKIYYEKYGCVTARKFDGGFLKLSGINPVVSLYPHQRSAIARIILTNACLLSHSVGTGKTYVMIAGGMEMRRIGTSRKNMYVVPNAIIEQWRNDFAFLYPDCNILVVDHRNTSPKNKEKTLALIRDGDYDAILISYNSFKAIPLSLKYKRRKLEETFNEIKSLDKANRYRKILSDLSLRIVELDAKIIEERNSTEQYIYFDDLGITSLFVDEAHNFKNITIASDSDLLGVYRRTSHIADDMLAKVNWLRSNHAKSIVFATGTPITNSLTDLFVMQTYLQPNELSYFEIETFDKWALMFGEKTENFEMDVDSCNFRIVERFNKFHNLTELSNILSGVADFHVEDDDSLFVEIKRNTIEVPLSTEQKTYLASLSARTDVIRKKTAPVNNNGNANGNKTASKKVPFADNLLKVTSDGRKMALDIRLVNQNVLPSTKTKVQACAEQVYRIYTEEPTVTQLVFCDISTPKESFNIYDELADELARMGMPRYLISFIQDCGNSTKKRKTITDALNDGKSKVLLGSTFMLGTGVNVQKHLFAVHHLDVPWRPADMIQREGRMIRQGNENHVVEIYRYVTEGSFDAYSWQLLESKQRFISQLLSGSLDKRDGDEVDSLVLQYADIKALAIGNPKIKERVQTYNELSRMKLLKMHRISRKNVVEANMEAYKKELEKAREQYRMLEKDYRLYSEKRVDKFPFKELGEQIQQECAKSIIREKPVELGEIFGFKILVPTVCSSEYPLFYLMANYEKTFKLYNDKGVTLSTTEVARQIDKYLQGIPSVLTEVHKKELRLERNIRQAKEELVEEENLDEKITLLTEKLATIENELGVKKDE